MTETITPTTPYLLDPAFPNLEGINRMERAKIILKQHRSVQKKSRNTYAVKSQSGISTYTVIKTDNGFTCNCPDHILNKHQCKHILAVKTYIQERDEFANTKTDNGSFRRDWSTYNLGSINSGKLNRIFLRQLCDTIEVPEQTMGRPGIPLDDMIFVAVMKVASKSSSRDAHGLIEDLEAMGFIKNAPAFNRVNVFLNKPEITPLLHELVRLSAAPLASVENSFSIDSSGFRTSNFGEWCDTKHGKTFTDKKGKQTIKARREHQWVKCHISSGNLTHVIADVVITPNKGENTADAKQFSALLSNTTGYFDVESVMADPAYVSRENFAAADKFNVTPYIYFKNGMTGKAKGCPLFNQMFSKFITEYDEYMEFYNVRNNVESTFGAVKAKFGEVLKSKNYTSQVNELLCKIIAYNMSVLSNAFFVNDAEINFEGF